ncbi:MAG: hypothetical protein ACLQBD_32895 [Syntrophobacteraceae bacterium]|jgi:hypothetical protein
MLEREKADELVLEALKRVKGIAEAKPFADEDRRKVVDLEHEAEAKSLMGLGKVINAGIREVTKCDWIYVALTDMDFVWSCQSNLVMKKGDDVVGEEVTDKETISRLAGNKNVWFMHKNFVVYKDKVSFPQDVMKKICYFEIPCHPADWCIIGEGELQCHSIVFGSPSTPCDIFLKDQYFHGADVKGSGTVLIGVKL